MQSVDNIKFPSHWFLLAKSVVLILVQIKKKQKRMHLKNNVLDLDLLLKLELKLFYCHDCTYCRLRIKTWSRLVSLAMV